MYPSPRRVWSNLTGCSSSIFFRSRFMYTSIVFEKGSNESSQTCAAISLRETSCRARRQEFEQRVLLRRQFNFVRRARDSMTGRIDRQIVQLKNVRAKLRFAPQ